MRALAVSRGDLVVFSLEVGIELRRLDTLRASQPEDRATLESDPSAALEAEMGGSRQGFPPLRFSGD
jgi:hypothetical protein